MRLARDLGSSRDLFPEGIEKLTDLPHTLFTAIQTALTFLSFDELEEDERPPKRIWLDGEAMKDWFREVKRKRKEKYGGDGHQPIDDPVQNAAAKGLIVK